MIKQIKSSEIKKYIDLNQNIVHIYKREDQLGNITETNILIIKSIKPKGISFINSIFKLNLNNYIKVIPNQSNSKLIENISLVARYEAKDNNQEESEKENNNKKDINNDENENENAFRLPLPSES